MHFRQTGEINMIKTENGMTRYFDKNGIEIKGGCQIKYSSGNIEKVYSTIDGELGEDATNKKWIESGRAVECEYGVYPLTLEDTEDVVVIQKE